ncbi:MAG: hypothetical protein OHK0057_30150 [Thermoflexibacter sp.]
MKKLIFSLLLLPISCLALAQFNVNISAGATANVTISNAGTVRTFTANAVGANVQISDIIAAYTGGVTEVRILTGTTGGSENGNITLSNAIDYNGIGLGKTLTLIAHSNISIINPITDGTVGGDLLNLNLTGNGTFPTGTNAGVRITTTVITNGGNITIVGTQSAAGAKGVDIPSGTILTGGGFLNITGTANGVNAGLNTCDGIDIQSTSTNTNGGAIVLNGTSSNINGNNGVQIDSPLNSGTGAITITGVSNGNTTGVVNTLGSITTTSGNVTITGTANSTLLTAVPQVLAFGVLIVQPIATGSGNINIVGTSAANAPAFLTIGVISSTSGSIAIQGTNTNTDNVASLASGVRVSENITTGGNGAITIRGESNADSQAIDVTSAGSISTVNGDINIKGVNTKISDTNSISFGVLIAGGVNITGSGNILLEGENSSNVASIRVTGFTPLTTNTGNIFIKGKNNNTTASGAIGVGISKTLQSALGSIFIEGESNSPGTSIGITSPISTTIGNILIIGKAKNTITQGGSGIIISAPISSTQGSITIEGEINAGNTASAIETFIGGTSTITSTSGNILLKGIAKGTGRRGITISKNITSQTGKITLMGESEGAGGSDSWGINLSSFDGTQAIATTGNGGDITLRGIVKNAVGGKGVVLTNMPITTTTGKINITGETAGQADAVHIGFNSGLVSSGGDISINGKCTNPISGAGVRANGVINAGAGKITIMGECDASNSISLQAQGVFIAATAPLTTNGGDILLNGTARGTTGLLAMGVQLDAVVNAGAGKITIIGENNADNIEAVRITNALNNTNADISISGRAKNPNNTVAGVRITAPINASRHLNIIGASPNNGILVLQRLQALGNINLLTERGGLRVEDVIQSIAAGSIDICVATGGNLAVTGGAGGLSISTTNNANINITNGTGTLSVGNPTANVRGLIANGGNIVPEGVYPTTIFGNIRIKGSVGIQTFNPLFTTTLNGFTFILNLDACVPMVKWASTLTTANFDIANFPTGTSIHSVSRLNDTQVRVIMNFTGDDIDFDFPLAQLIAKSSAFTPLSNEVAFATPVRASQILAPVIRGRAGSQSVRLEWTSVTGAVNYEVYSLTAGQAQQLIGTTSDTVLIVTGLRNATTYSFKVIAVSKNGFKSDFSNTVELRPSIILGTEEETENRIFKVYPNPSSGSFYLQANELKGKNATLTITDLSGRVVYQRNWQIVGNIESQVELNLAQGIYLLQLDTEKENFKRKLLIEK